MAAGPDVSHEALLLATVTCADEADFRARAGGCKHRKATLAAVPGSGTVGPGE